MMCAGVPWAPALSYLPIAKKQLELKVMAAGNKFVSAAKRLAAILFVALMLLGMPAPAAIAEQFAPISRPPTYPVVLQQIKLIGETTSESRFEFTFDPTATTFTPALGRPDGDIRSRGPAARGEGEQVQARG